MSNILAVAKTPSTISVTSAQCEPSFAEAGRWLPEQLDPADPDYAKSFTAGLLGKAAGVGASDVHLHRVAAGLWIRWRIDGVLQEVGTFSAGLSSDVVTRLKVLAGLLTYRSDAPQEGRLQTDEPAAAHNVEMRLSTFPSLHGESAVIRIFAADQQLNDLDDLGLPADVAEQLTHQLAETSGAILVTGPAGSGKTTTCYAALRHIAASTAGARSIVSIEDPVEVAVPGVAQSQVAPAAGFDLAAGLKALLRQDPEVVMVSEIRDPTAASLALGASLTGHLVLGSFHAGSAAGAIGRLADMGVEPYVLRAGVLAIVSQRLVRRLCDCAAPADSEEEKLGLPVAHARRPVGCPKCHESGYRGRTLLAELLLPRSETLGRAVLSGADSVTIEQLAIDAGMTTRWHRAIDSVQAGITSCSEVLRVLGFNDPWSHQKPDASARQNSNERTPR